MCIRDRKCPDLCRLEKSNVQGGVSYELAKSRLSIRFLPPYSEERRQKARDVYKRQDKSKCTGKAPEPPAETSEPEKEKPARLNPAAIVLSFLVAFGSVFAFHAVDEWILKN